jgi:hypothetical protein
MLAVFGFVTAATYLGARRVTGALPAALAALSLVAFRVWSSPQWQILDASSLAVAAALGAFLILGAERSPGPVRGALAGLLAGGALVTHPGVGGLGALGCAAALVLAAGARGRRAPAATLVAFVAGTALVLAVFVSRHGALALPWQSTLGPDGPRFPRLRPVVGQDTLVRGRFFGYLPALWADLHWRDLLSSHLFTDTNLFDLAVKLAFHLPYAVVAFEGASVARAWRRDDDRAALAARVAQLVFASALVAALSPPRDWGELSILVVPLVPIFARQAACVAAVPSPARHPLRFAGSFALAFYLAQSFDLGWLASRTYSAPVEGPRGRAYAHPADAAALGGALAAVGATPADRPVLAVPCVSAAAFLAGRPLLGRFPRPDADATLAAGLDAHPDATLLYTLSHLPSVPSFRLQAPGLAGALAARYRLGPVFGPDPERLIVGIGAPAPREAARATIRLADRLADARAETVLHVGAPAPADPRVVAGVATWPLTPGVLWIEPPLDGETRLVVPVTVPPRARLRLAAGVNPDLWQTSWPFSVRLRVGLESRAGSRDLLAVERDVFARPEEDRAWSALDVDLGAEAGEEVRVVLAVAAGIWSPATRELAGFADPRLVVPEGEP